MTKNKLKLNVLEVLRFFDEAPKTSMGHATAIVSVIGEDLGVSLFQKCLLEKDGIRTKIIMKNGVPLQPTNGTGRGDRLDRWLQEEVLRNGKTMLYQIEIKNWSAHAIGGKKLSLDAELKVLENHRRDAWANCWDAKENCFPDKRIAKVLTKMKVPDGTEGTVDVKPVICFWDAVHPEGKAEPLFECNLSSLSKDGFSSFLVFSMSNYLRSMNETMIELEMPTATSRIEWFYKLFDLAGE